MIDIHADDFAVSFHASQDIISLCKDGKLDSISIIPNMSCFEECVSAYKNAMIFFPHHIAVSVHLNFMEGHCMAPVSLVPDLVDKNGYFKVSWVSLLLSSCNPIFRKKIRQQLAVEIKYQINTIIKTGLLSDGICLDSHQHPHHIPVVCDALRDILKKDIKNIAFIRNAREPVSLYIRHPSLFLSCGPVNIIKCILLNFLSFYVIHILKRFKTADGYLSGVLFSGNMNSRLEPLTDAFISFSKKTGKHFEILFHPGSVLPEEITAEYCKPGFVNFHLSAYRKTENEEVRKLYNIFHRTCNKI